MLKIIFRPKSNEVQGSGENYVMNSLTICTPPQSFFLVIKSRRIRWAGHVARMREKRVAYRIIVGKPEGK
jgi:hypothetical protein